MTRYSKEDYELVLSLYEQELPMTEISKKTGVGYRTVQAWVYGENKPHDAYTREEWDEINKKKQTPEARKKRSETMTGRKRPRWVRDKLSKSKMGSKNPNWAGNKTKTASGARQRALVVYGDLCPEGCEIHHIDGNPWNNDPSNIEFVTRKEHMEKDGRLKRFVNGIK